MREIKHLSIHQWIRFAIPDSQQPTSPIGFLFLKLPPPPCAVLLVINWVCHLRHLPILRTTGSIFGVRFDHLESIEIWFNTGDVLPVDFRSPNPEVPSGNLLHSY